MTVFLFLMFFVLSIGNITVTLTEVVTHHMYYHSLWPYIREKNRTEHTAEGIIVDVINRFLLYCRNNKTIGWKTKFYPAFESSLDYVHFLQSNFSREEGILSDVKVNSADYLWLGPFLTSDVETVPKNDWVNSALRTVQSPGAHVIVDRELVSWKYKMLEGMKNSLNYLVLAILMSICIGAFVFLIESRQENEYGETLYEGVWNGFWWAVVTMTTIGYGDIVPRTHIGQFIGTFWLIAGILMGSVITATVTDAMAGITYLGISNRDVAVLKYSWEEQIATEWKANVKSYKTYDDVLQAVRNGSVFAALINTDIVSWRQDEIHYGNVPLAIVYQIKHSIPIRINFDKFEGLTYVWSCIQQHREDIFDSPYRKYFKHIEEDKVYYVTFSEMLINDWIGALLLITSLVLIGLSILAYIIEKYITKRKFYIRDMWIYLASLCKKKEHDQSMNGENSRKTSQYSLEMEIKDSIVPEIGFVRATPNLNNYMNRKISGGPPPSALSNRRHSRFPDASPTNGGVRRHSRALFTSNYQNGGFVNEEETNMNHLTSRLDLMEQNINDIKKMMTQLVKVETKEKKKFSVGQFRNKDLSGALM